MTPTLLSPRILSSRASGEVRSPSSLPFPARSACRPSATNPSPRALLPYSPPFALPCSSSWQVLVSPSQSSVCDRTRGWELASLLTSRDLWTGRKFSSSSSSPLLHLVSSSTSVLFLFLLSAPSFSFLFLATAGQVPQGGVEDDSAASSHRYHLP